VGKADGTSGEYAGAAAVVVVVVVVPVVVVPVVPSAYADVAPSPATRTPRTTSQTPRPIASVCRSIRFLGNFFTADPNPVNKKRPPGSGRLFSVQCPRVQPVRTNTASAVMLLDVSAVMSGLFVPSFSEPRNSTMPRVPSLIV